MVVVGAHAAVAAAAMLGAKRLLNATHCAVPHVYYNLTFLHLAVFLSCPLSRTQPLLLAAYLNDVTSIDFLILFFLLIG